MKFADLPTAKKDQIRQFDVSLHAWEKHIQQEAKIAHEMLKGRKQNPNDPVTFTFVFATMTYWPAEPDPLCIFRKSAPVAQRRYNCKIILDDNPFLEKCLYKCRDQDAQASEHPMAGEPHSFLLHDLCDAISTTRSSNYLFDEVFKVAEIACDIEISLPFFEEIEWKEKDV